MARMPTVNPYQSDVRTMSDAEIEALDGELCETYRYGDDCGESWSDDHAEARHQEFAAERQRRFMLANPDYKLPALGPLMREVQGYTLANLTYADYRLPGSKIGDTIRIQKPRRFFAERSPQ